MIIGLLGKPSSGKSTFYKASTLAEVEIHPRPFTTIKTSEGIAFVKINCIDKEFNIQCNPKQGYCKNNIRFVPINIIDVPGLIPGSHQGKGRGNQFLDDLRQADILIHIVDISGSTNELGEQVNPLSYDPSKDIEFLEYEIDMWILSIIKKGWDKFSKKIQQENLDIKKALAEQLSGLKINEDNVQNAIHSLKLSHNPTQWSNNDLKELATLLRKKTKTIIIAANKIDIQGAKFNLDKVKEKFPDYIIMPCSSEFELALKEASKHNLIDYISGEDDFKIINKEKLNEKQLKALEFIKKFLKEYKTTGVQDILNYAVFNILKLIPVYPVSNSKLEDKDGRKLPDCFLVSKETTALALAYKIHTDIGNKFVKALDLKTKKVIGKDSFLKENDVIEIKTK